MYTCTGKGRNLKIVFCCVYTYTYRFTQCSSLNAAAWFGLDQGTYVGKTGSAYPVRERRTQHQLQDTFTSAQLREGREGLGDNTNDL
jgi:hypothetical protein